MKTEWRWELPQLLLLTLMALASTIAWSRVPDIIPVHWNLQGEADRYGGKTLGLWLTPAIAAGLYLLLRFLPAIDPGRANLENSARPLRVIRLSLMIFLTTVHFVTLSAALGVQVRMNAVIGLAVAALFVVLGNLMGKIRPNWMAGIRTPWTLSSSRSWNQTHRLAGPAFMLMGVGAGLLGLFPSGWLLAVVLTGSGLALVGLVVYSYFVWRDDPDRVPPSGITPGVNGN